MNKNTHKQTLDSVQYGLEIKFVLSGHLNAS